MSERRSAWSTYLSWPAASRLTSECAARIQNLSCSRLKVCTPVRFDMSQTRMLLSSELETMMSCTAAHRYVSRCASSIGRLTGSAVSLQDHRLSLAFTRSVVE